MKYDFSGVWRSSYFKADVEDRTATEHYVTMRFIGDQLIVESIPGPNESYLLGRFTVDDRVLTGSYQSQNSPNNSVKGGYYYGAAQLVLDEDGKAARGMGVGYGKDMRVRPTVWELIHVGQQQPQESQQTAQESQRT